MITARTILFAFLFFFLIRFLLERILASFNARHIARHADEVPSALSGVIGMETHAKSTAYSLARIRFGHVHAFVGALLTLLFLFSGWIPWLDAHLPFGGLSRGVVLILVFTLASSLLDLPLEWYDTFKLEARFGFNKTTQGTFWLDQAKGMAVSVILGVPLLYAILAFISHGGTLWWLWAALFVIAFQAVMMIVYPVWIAPLFNKFTPLPEGELKARIEALAEHCQFAVRGLFVMDGSKRSAHSNAYFTGLGRARRIVFFDTLVEQLTTHEMAAVLAHEIGHYKKRHIVKFILLSSGMTILGFWILSLVIAWPPFYEAFGLVKPSPTVGILLFSLTAGSFGFWIKPFLNLLSRKHEYEADAYAAQQTEDPVSIRGALVKLSEKNLSALAPHPAYSAWHYSHPTLLERLGALGAK